MASHTTSQVALVTGSSSGFGLLATVELARRGYRVFASMRNLERAERLDNALAAAGVSAELVQLDVTDHARIAELVADIHEQAGRIDVLVNNAGYGLGGMAFDYTLDELRAQFETNFFGLVAMTKAVMPGMRERRYGRIINVSSVSGRIALPGTSAYAASKFAVEGFSEALRHELLPFDVYVSLVEPGTFRTDIFERNLRVADAADDPSSPFHQASLRLQDLVNKRVEKSTNDPAWVATLIADIADDPRPRLRYLIGRGTQVQAVWSKLIPRRLWEAAIGRVTGLSDLS